MIDQNGLNFVGLPGVSVCRKGPGISDALRASAHHRRRSWLGY